MFKTIAFVYLSLIGLSASAQDPMYDICPIKNSEEVPDVSLFDAQGKEVNLKTYIYQKPVVLVFYRGGWCPYCTRHLSALQEVKEDIVELGYELIAITPDDYTKLDSSVSRSNGFDYTLLSDKDMKAIEAFGIGWQVSDEMYEKYKNKHNLDLEEWSGSEKHILPVPAVFVIKEGKIEYQHVNPNYSKRLSPNVLMSFLVDS